MQPSEPAGSRAGIPFAILLALFGALPFAVTRLPQLTDYPSHLARYHVMLDGGRDAWLAHYYAFDWNFTGNLGADLLMVPLGRLLGVETAGWLLGALIAVLGGLGVCAISWVLRRRIDFATVLAAATLWSPAMAMGFYNFCLALALALLAFALWVRLEGWRWRPALFVPIGLLVWLCHVSGWGVLGVLVFGHEWSRRKHWRSLLAPWPLFFAAIPLALAPVAQGSLNYGANVLANKKAFWFIAMRGESMALDLGLLAVVIAVALAALAKRRIDGRIGWAALAIVGLTLVMPRHLGGGDFADYRLMAVALTLACLAIDWPGVRLLTLFALALFAARIGNTALEWRNSAQQMSGVLKALDHLPLGARVASAVQIERNQWDIEPFEHIGSYATLQRSALVNSHFAVPGIHMLRLREGGPDFADPSHRVFHSPGERIDLSGFAPAGRADWLWYVGAQMPDRLPAGASVVYRAPGTMLLRLAKPEAQR
jgi:hypothetical protein